MNVLRFLQHFNDATPWLKGVKDRIPFRNAIYNVLVKARNRRELAGLKFDEQYVVNRLGKLAADVVPTFYVLLPEAIGDLIACEPITRYLKSLRPDGIVKWLVRRPLAQTIETNGLISEVILIDSLKEGVDICRTAERGGSAIVLWCRLNRTQCRKTGFMFYNEVNPAVDISNYYSLGTLLEAFCRAAGIPPLKDCPHYELSGTKNLSGLEPGSYAVIHCNSSEQARNWTAEGWNRIATELMRKGVQVVEVGTEKVIVSDDPLYRDLTGFQHIPDVVKTISEARFFMGCDSCFAHAANAVETPAVVLLGKYEIWDVYNPYSGEFAREHFKVVRAKQGKRVADIPVDDVWPAICEVKEKVI